MFRFVLMCALGGTVLGLAQGARAQSGPQDALPALAPQYYLQHCVTCHDAPEESWAPGLAALRERTPEAI